MFGFRLTLALIRPFVFFAVTRFDIISLLLESNVDDVTGFQSFSESVSLVAEGRTRTTPSSVLTKTRKPELWRRETPRRTSVHLPRRRSPLRTNSIEIRLWKISFSRRSNPTKDKPKKEQTPSQFRKRLPRPPTENRTLTMLQMWKAWIHKLTKKKKITTGRSRAVA